jgi:proliferating cell nuclear antigen
MNIEIHNESKKTCTKFALKLLDINEHQIEVPDMTMTTITPMASVDFQRICRDMHNIGNIIEITRENKKLKLQCMGDFANQETEIECTEESPKISGEYSLRYMNIFTKATSMCSTVQSCKKNRIGF